MWAWLRRWWRRARWSSRAAPVAITERTSSHREAEHLLAQAAERLGFDLEPQGDGVTRLHGTRGALEVTIFVRLVPWSGGQTRYRLSLRVDSPRPLTPAPLRIISRAELRRSQRRSSHGDPGHGDPGGNHGGQGRNHRVTRDPSFDDEVFVEGRADVAVALLGSRARASVAGHGGAWRIEGRTIEWRAQRAPLLLSDLTRHLVRLALELEKTGTDVVAGLEERLLSDPHPGTRRRALALLLEHHRDDPRTPGLIRMALYDRLPRLRLDAALALDPEEARITLVDLLGLPSTPNGLRQAAANHLPLDAADVRAALRRLFEARDPELKITAVELMGRLGGPEDLAFIEPTARAFGSGARLRRTAAEARARILARHQDRDAGQLALADPESLVGAVSPSPDDT